MLRMPKISLLMLAMMMASTMPLLAKEQYVDPVFGDTIDRTAEDFVTVSLLVADPGTYLYSVLGHAALRMQCPVFGLDYSFSYESMAEEDDIIEFFQNKLNAGLFRQNTKDYLDYYASEYRGVYEYKLFLPSNVKQEFWRVLDNFTSRGASTPYNYYEDGCAIMCVKLLERALGEYSIKYDHSLYDNSPTGRDLVKEFTKDALWVRFILCFIAGSEVDVPLYGKKQLLIPIDLVDAWQKATINGEPIMSSEPIVLVEGEPQAKNNWFTPLIAMLLVLALSIANLFWNKPYFDWLMLVAQTVVGAFMMYLICFSDLCCTSWNWLIIPFNILPAIFWYWRKWWALPYACALIIWCGVMSYVAIWGHVLVDWPHIVLVLAWTVVLIKQRLVRTALLPHYNRTITAQLI